MFVRFLFSQNQIIIFLCKAAAEQYKTIQFRRSYITSVLFSVLCLHIQSVSLFLFLAFRSSETGARGENLPSPEASKHR